MTQLKKISGYAPAWDHAVGIICVHEAGGKVCVFLLVFLYVSMHLSDGLFFSAYAYIFSSLLIISIYNQLLEKTEQLV